MPRTVLVTEGDSPLGGALVRLLVSRGYAVASTTSRAAATSAAVGAGTGQSFIVPWNRRSPLSARTIFLDALNAFGDVDEALILEPPCPPAASLHEAASADIERALDDAKGPLFLAREALAHFLSRGKGLLCMVAASAGEAPLESAVRECLRGVCTALMATTGDSGESAALPRRNESAALPRRNESAALPRRAVLVNGFQSGGAQLEEYAAFIDRTLEEKARKITGRWFTCPTRGGFFQGVLPGSKHH